MRYKIGCGGIKLGAWILFQLREGELVTKRRFSRFALLSVSLFLTPAMSGGMIAWGQATADESSSTASSATVDIDSGLLSAFKLRSIGPALMSGRISDIAVNPKQPNTWYVAAGSGNLWKTTNAGTTWSAIFDQYPSYSIGCVTIDPKNPNIIWVGTGEDVGGRHVGFGDGVYVSYDAGGSFQNMGLRGTEHISKILIHGEDSNIMLVAAQGPLWNEGGERGLYRSNDGGKTWSQVLAGGPWTGCTEVVADPSNPDVMYAALHQRHRTVAALLNTGPESGIYKSIDGGESWTKLGRGLPGENMGKIALVVSPQKPNIVYASIELPATKGGTWRSEDYGASWKKVSDFVSGGTGPHYYQELWADPHRFHCLYHANNSLMRSLDGGATWENIEGYSKHGDNHAIAFHPLDADMVICGTDGGVYASYDFAKTWQYVPNLSLTQFYKVDVDNDTPFYHIIGGTQDNSTQYGPSRTRAATGIVSSDWIVPIGGDGHDNAIHPENPDIIFCESQEGYIRRFDRRTGQSVAIRPAPGDGEASFRFNWDSPILISPHNANRLYFASNHLHRSDDLGDSWTTLSPDLSRNENRLAMPMMGRKHGVDAGYDLYAMSQYGSITSISESPVVADLIYVGTDDGLIQVTEDGGQTWRKVERIYGIPERAFVNDIKADRHDPDTVYACFDNHKEGDFKPYLIRSRDRGRTWESISADLPDKHLVWRFEQDHVMPELMFLGTEFGLFVSLNAGASWVKLSQGMPTIPVRDLAIQKRENDLVCATFGRGFYVLDDYSPLRELAKLQRDGTVAELFAPRTTAWYQETNVSPVSSFGDDFYRAENPPLGAVFTVYVREATETARERRKKAEAASARGNTDVEIPSFETLADEAAEVKPQLLIEIRDAQNEMVRRVPCPAAKGLHRVVWDMTEVLPVASSPSTLVAPGTYSAQLLRLHGEKVEKIGGQVEVALVAIYEPTLPPVNLSESRRFMEETAQLLARWRHVTRTHERLSAELLGREKLVAAASKEPENLLNQIVALKEQQRKLTRSLAGDVEKRSRFVVDEPTAGERLQSALYQTARSSHGPTATSRDQLQLAKAGVETVEADLETCEEKIRTLREAMTQSGLIWVE
jgi:photosystem II stability/assembly factor-like uncharacterized protein